MVLSFAVIGTSWRRPISRLIAYMVFSGLVMLWRLAGWPTRISPLSAKATIDGVVRPPSAFSMTVALFPSITATQELVVPRSIPIAFAITGLLARRFFYKRPSAREQSRQLNPSDHDIALDA